MPAHLVLLLQSPDHAVNGLLKVDHVHRLLLIARRHQGTLVAHIGNVLHQGVGDLRVLEGQEGTKP